MGLRWYLNFYIALKGEELKPGDIILIDEPGMYLHPKAQQEMRGILNEESANNQIRTAACSVRWHLIIRRIKRRVVWRIR